MNDKTRAAIDLSASLCMAQIAWKFYEKNFQLKGCDKLTRFTLKMALLGASSVGILCGELTCACLKDRDQKCNQKNVEES